MGLVDCVYNIKSSRKLCLQFLIEEAIKLIQDGDTIRWCGSVGVLNLEGVLGALEARFLSQGHLFNLTVLGPPLQLE